MASSRNGKGMGMKILWIPGKKRHDRKGIYSSTNKEVNKNYLQPKKNQVWSLGGTEQRKLINIDVNDDIASSSTSAALSVASQATHIVNPICIAAGAAGTGAALKADDNSNLDENSDDKEKIIDKEILKNGEACNTDNIDIEVDDPSYHNAATMRYRKKTGSNNTDLDSIEHLDFEDEVKKNEVLEDDIDSVSMQRMKSANVSERRRRSAKKKYKDLEKEKKNEEKIVDCLYLGLMCCDMPCAIL
ncbi:CLUMA_CG004341, isoform A [Clunio marinus]|uniref:CLUMA_CG004341, isoform A n=1 Tax=Clunio marinus TaxID=568069 RepID=A0A1J1HRG3_9DIPT|nr:CLUMA_CG004341, isoform A [Clunio marinus]